MSTHSPNTPSDDRAFPHAALRRETSGVTADVAPLVEHQARLAYNAAVMMEQLRKLKELGSDDWLVTGPGRLERWGVGATVFGPNAVFLLWAISGRAEPALWVSSERCRQYVTSRLGAQFRGAVEIVFFNPRREADATAVDELTRSVCPGFAGLAGFNVLFAETDDNLHLLLAKWVPMEGLEPISVEWIRELRAAAEMDWQNSGPTDGACRLAVLEEPRDW